MTMETPMEPSRDDMRRPVDPNVWGVDFPYNSTRATGQIQIGIVKGMGPNVKEKGGLFLLSCLGSFNSLFAIFCIILYSTIL